MVINGARLPHWTSENGSVMGPLKPKMTFKTTDAPQKVDGIMTDCGTLTVLHSVTYHWTPHGFSLQG